VKVRVSLDGNAVGLTSILHQGNAVFLARTLTPLLDFFTDSDVGGRLATDSAMVAASAAATAAVRGMVLTNGLQAQFDPGTFLLVLHRPPFSCCCTQSTCHRDLIH